MIHPEVEAISLIICLKNEAESIVNNSHTWINQLDPEDELILVDDFSEDATLTLIKKLASKHENVFAISCSENKPGKKQALTEGIDFSKKKVILLTDADCKPGEEWKKTMSKHFAGKMEFLLGFGPLYERNGWLNKFQRFENILTALQYFSYAKAGLPYMGVGRNLMFRKSVFDSEIYKHDLASGDDDLLVSAKANKYNTQTCLDPKTFVYSEAPRTLQLFLRQKSRHVSSSVEYKPIVKILLSLFSVSQIMGNLLLVALLFTSLWKIGLLLFFLKAALISFTFYTAGKLVHERKLYRYAIILDLCLTFYYVVLAFLFPFTNRLSWN